MASRRPPTSGRRGCRRSVPKACASRSGCRLAAGWSAPHRAQLLHAGDVLIIDDSYNASPASVRAALELLADFPGRHVAVLGEMRELGDQAEAGHREVGAAAAR